MASRGAGSQSGSIGSQGSRPSAQNFWDSDLVSGIAFHPRKCPAKSNRSAGGGGGWVDGDLLVSDGEKIAYRLYLAPAGRAQASESSEQRCVMIYFHANAELCTDLEREVNTFYECGVEAVLCPEFRGFAWSSGSPKLSRLCGDAEVAAQALPQILQSAGVRDFVSLPVVVSGRSLGGACAVHVAAHSKEPNPIAGLLIESGCMSISDLPMVAQMGAMMPQMLQMLRSEPDPLGSLETIKRVVVPTLVIHGDQDEVVPVSQAVAAHRHCASTAKKLVRYPKAHHNDVRIVARREFLTEFRRFVAVASGALQPEALLEKPPPSPGAFGMFVGAMRCIPGVRRCLHSREDDPASSMSSGDRQ